MTFDRPARRARGENIVPMINVVFLLLIFFMISSELTPPPPVEVTPPSAEFGATPEARDPIFLGVDGSLVWGALRGDAALAALASMPPTTPVTIRADRALPATELATLLSQLSSFGLTQVSLSVQAGG